MSKLCHTICDYGIGDGAFSEVIQKLHYFAPNWQFMPLSVTSFSTLSTGFWIAQLGLHQADAQTIIFSNTAPRHDQQQARDANEGEPFVFAELSNGVQIGVINAGYALSFVKNEIVNLRYVDTANKGSQFRSRDFYPQAFVESVNGIRDLGDQINKDLIPDYPRDQVIYIDGYGNIKTSIKKQDLSLTPGHTVEITIKDITMIAIYSNGIFNIPHGQLVFAPGSSGNKDNPFMEISYRTTHVGDQSAYNLFNYPPVESSIMINENSN